MSTYLNSIWDCHIFNTFTCTNIVHFKITVHVHCMGSWHCTYVHVVTRVSIPAVMWFPSCFVYVFIRIPISSSGRVHCEYYPALECPSLPPSWCSPSRRYCESTVVIYVCTYLHTVHVCTCLGVVRTCTCSTCACVQVPHVGVLYCYWLVQARQ